MFNYFSNKTQSIPEDQQSRFTQEEKASYLAQHNQ